MRNQVEHYIDIIPEDSDEESKSLEYEFDITPQTMFGLQAERGISHGLTALGFTEVYNQLKLHPDQPDVLLTPEQANKKYGLDLSGKSPVREEYAINLSNSKKRDIFRNEMINRGPTDFKNRAIGMGVEMTASLLDPIELGAMFIPIVGQVRSTAWAARFGPTGARLLTGAVEGGVSSAILEVPRYAMAKDLEYDYTEYDSFINISGSTLFGAGMYAGLGKIGDVLGISYWSRQQRLGNITPEAHETMLRTAVGQLINDEVVNIAPIQRASIDEAYFRKLERDEGVNRTLIDESGNLIDEQRSFKTVLEDATKFKTPGKERYEQLDIDKRELNEFITDLYYQTESPLLERYNLSDLVEAQRKLGQDIIASEKGIARLEKQLEILKKYPINKAKEIPNLEKKLLEKKADLEEMLKIAKAEDQPDIWKFREEIIDLEEKIQLLKEEPRDPRSIYEAEVTLERVKTEFEERKRLLQDILEARDVVDELKKEYKQRKEYLEENFDPDKELIKKQIIAKRIEEKINQAEKIEPITKDIAIKQGSKENNKFYDEKILEEIEKRQSELPVKQVLTPLQKAKQALTDLYADNKEFFKEIESVVEKPVVEKKKSKTLEESTKALEEKISAEELALKAYESLPSGYEQEKIKQENVIKSLKEKLEGYKEQLKTDKINAKMEEAKLADELDSTRDLSLKDKSLVEEKKEPSKSTEKLKTQLEKEIKEYKELITQYNKEGKEYAELKIQVEKGNKKYSDLDAYNWTPGLPSKLEVSRKKIKKLDRELSDAEWDQKQKQKQKQLEIAEVGDIFYYNVREGDAKKIIESKVINPAKSKTRYDANVAGKNSVYLTREKDTPWSLLEIGGIEFNEQIAVKLNKNLNLYEINSKEDLIKLGIKLGFPEYDPKSQFEHYSETEPLKEILTYEKRSENLRLILGVDKSPDDLRREDYFNSLLFEKEHIAKLKKLGYDGINVTTVDVWGGEQVVIFDPKNLTPVEITALNLMEIADEKIKVSKEQAKGIEEASNCIL